MTTFHEWFDGEKAKAEASECGQAFLQMGFEFWHCGGGLTAWRKVVGDKACLANSDDSGIDTGGEWCVGLYALADDDTLAVVDHADWKAAVAAISASFDLWAASRERIAAADVPEDHHARDVTEHFAALHVFKDGAWFAEHGDGQFWALVQVEEETFATVEDATRWLWDNWSCHNGEGDEEGQADKDEEEQRAAVARVDALAVAMMRTRPDLREMSLDEWILAHHDSLSASERAAAQAIVDLHHALP